MTNWVPLRVSRVSLDSNHGAGRFLCQLRADRCSTANAWLAAHCEVKAVARPTSDSELKTDILIPGMGQCYGGAVPASIAPAGSIAATDPEHDLTLSLEQSVEQGIASQMAIGSGKAPNDPSKTMYRPICPYPQVTRYKGTGDTNDAASFECAARPAQR